MFDTIVLTFTKKIQETSIFSQNDLMQNNIMDIEPMRIPITNYDNINVLFNTIKEFDQSYDIKIHIDIAKTQLNQPTRKFYRRAT